MYGENDLLGDRYRLLRLLGEGGAGAVWQARNEAIGKRVAVKLLHGEHLRDPLAVERFRQEARASAAIGHKSIIDIYDIGETDGVPFLVMELLEGESLGDLLERVGVLDLGEATYVACQVLSALGAAHRQGIVHRDLKPDNVFVVRTDEALPDVKLLDFGISQMVDASAPDKRLTRSGVVMGTPYYMSPEQARGSRRLDARADLYAVGVILYECLTGRVPFLADNVLALLNKIQHEDPRPLRELRPDLPAELDAAVSRALARDPSSRFDDAGEMLEALLAFVDDVAQARVPRPAVRGSSRISGLLADPPRQTPIPRTIKEEVPEGAAATVSRTAATPAMPRDAAAVSATGSGRRRPALAVAIGVIALAGLAAAFVGLRPGAGPTDTPRAVQLRPAAPEDPAPSRGGDGDAPISASHPAPSPASTVPEGIALDGLPAGAAVAVDGRPVEGSHLDLLEAGGSVDIAVTAPGYVPWRREVRRPWPARIEVDMEPLRSKRPPSARRDGRDPVPPRRDPQGSGGGLPRFGDGP